MFTSFYSFECEKCKNKNICKFSQQINSFKEKTTNKNGELNDVPFSLKLDCSNYIAEEKIQEHSNDFSNNIQSTLYLTLISFLKPNGITSFANGYNREYRYWDKYVDIYQTCNVASNVIQNTNYGQICNTLSTMSKDTPRPVNVYKDKKVTYTLDDMIDKLEDENNDKKLIDSILDMISALFKKG